MHDPQQGESKEAASGSAYPLYERVYLVLVACFVVTLVLTNVIGIKLFQSPIWEDDAGVGFALTTGILTYPLTFLFTDIVSEIYGKKRADFMVLLGFFMSLLMLAITQVAVGVAPHPYWVPAESPFYGNEADYQHAFQSVFALNGILLFGSMLAYLCAQLTDNRLYHFLKRLTNGRHLWLRNNGSTWVSQFVDTIIVNSILFYWGMGMDLKVGAGIMATIYVHKVLLAALDTPLIYLGVWGVRKILGEDPSPGMPAASEGASS
jgi:uncharacterized integral membrane protein (TIGR00697 family)